jgi:tagaturonate epimerase
MGSPWNELRQKLASQAPLDLFEREEIARDLTADLSGLALYPHSLSRLPGTAAVLGAQDGRQRRLVLLTGRSDGGSGFDQQPVFEARRDEVRLRVYDASPELILSLREHLPWLRPRTNPGSPGFSTGDRVGLATPAHVRAIEGSSFFPCLAQQSSAENMATGRSWKDVLADVLFGVLREGWRGGFGADADCLRTEAEIEAAAAAGYVRFTIDLGYYAGVVSNFDRKELGRRFVEIEQSIPGADGWRRRFLGRTFELQTGFRKQAIAFDEKSFLVTMLKYGLAFDRMRHMCEAVGRFRRGRPYEIEVSFFGSGERTTPHEHLFVALQAAEEGYSLAAVAPRFVGEFRKGLDYKGNPSKLARNMALHAAVARAVNSHAISIHSASDKFSIYPFIGEACDGNFHIKTSGTSYLEALRAAARRDRELFEAIVHETLEGWQSGASTYDFALDPSVLPEPERLDETELEEHYLGWDQGRHLLCESHGRILGTNGALKRKLVGLLMDHETLHHALITEHLKRHISLLEEGKEGRSA